MTKIFSNSMLSLKANPGAMACTKTDLTPLQSSEEVIHRSRQKRKLRYCLVTLLVVALISLLSILFLLHAICYRYLNVNKISTTESEMVVAVRNTSERSQTVISSTNGNYVLYFIDLKNKNGEKIWIIDEFNTKLQVIKHVSYDETVCYVSLLNRTISAKPTSAEIDWNREKRRSHEVMFVEEEATSDREFLGDRAKKLCDNVPLYWLKYVEVPTISNATVHVNSDNRTVYEDVSDREVKLESRDSVPSGRRVRRSIRSCATSCCWRVCCCDMKKFTWETSEHFTCKHICEKCGAAYKQNIEKLC